MNLQHCIKALHGQLDQLSPRERTGVMAASLALGLAVVWGLLLEPALHTIEQHPSTQAALLKQASQVLQEADALDALRQSKAKLRTPIAEVPQRLTQLLQEHGIAQQARMSNPDPQHIQVQFESANAAGVLAWLAQAETLNVVSLQRLDLSKPATGQLSGQVIFTKPNTP